MGCHPPLDPDRYAGEWSNGLSISHGRLCLYICLSPWSISPRVSLSHSALLRSSSLGWLVWFVLSGLGLSLSLSSRRFVCLVCLPVRLLLGGCLVVGAILSVLDLVLLGQLALALALLLLVVLLPLRAHRKLITATENLGSEC